MSKATIATRPARDPTIAFVADEAAVGRELTMGRPADPVAPADVEFAVLEGASVMEPAAGPLNTDPPTTGMTTVMVAGAPETVITLVATSIVVALAVIVATVETVIVEVTPLTVTVRVA